MVTFLLILLGIALLACAYLYYELKFEKDQCSYFYAEWDRNQRELGDVHDALRDVPEYVHGIGFNDLGRVISGFKSRCLSERNELWEIQNLLRGRPALENVDSAAEKVRLLLSTVQQAARGESVSNRSEDYTS